MRDTAALPSPPAALIARRRVREWRLACIRFKA